MPTLPRTHRQRENDRRGVTRERAYTYSRKVYASARWRRLRRWHLRRNATCVDPFGYHAADGHTLVPADHVDHITPVSKDPKRAYHLDNLQSLCSSCHGKKTARDQSQ